MAGGSVSSSVAHQWAAVSIPLGHPLGTTPLSPRPPRSVGRPQERLHAGSQSSGLSGLPELHREEQSDRNYNPTRMQSPWAASAPRGTKRQASLRQAEEEAMQLTEATPEVPPTDHIPRLLRGHLANLYQMCFRRLVQVRTPSSLTPRQDRVQCSHTYADSPIPAASVLKDAWAEAPRDQSRTGAVSTLLESPRIMEPETTPAGRRIRPTFQLQDYSLQACPDVASRRYKAFSDKLCSKR